LHGKGGSGAAPYDSGGVAYLAPSGNAAGWGGRQWLYFPESAYQQARAEVAAAIDDRGCGEVIVNGFSNGGAFAARLYCEGETFGGRLVGVIADDPVPDHGADGCHRPRGVRMTLYWTGALAATAQPGWNCAEQDWTCLGGSTVGIDAYAANLGTPVLKSPHDSHQPYTDAPQLNAW
jgi:pimeloyl-ACP methyl ester carboxylesterase